MFTHYYGLLELKLMVGGVLSQVYFHTPGHVPVFFWHSKHGFRDTELKFCIFS